MRRVTRFPVDAPIAFWWVDNGIMKRGEGQTRDISEAGAFVFSNMCPPAGSEIGFRILLPIVPGFEHKTRVEADGQVLRVERAPGREEYRGFAVLTRHTLLRSNSEAMNEQRARIANAN